MTITVIRRRAPLADLTPFAGAETRDDKARRAISTRLDREARADNTPARSYAGDAAYSGSLPRGMMRVRSDAKRTGRAGLQVRASQDAAFTLAGEAHAAREQCERLTERCAYAGRYQRRERERARS